MKISVQYVPIISLIKVLIFYNFFIRICLVIQVQPVESYLLCLFLNEIPRKFFRTKHNTQHTHILQGFVYLCDGKIIRK